MATARQDLGFGAAFQAAGLNVHRFGHGTQPVVLLHGWCADAVSNWHQAVDALASYDVIAVDLPGHGASPVSGSFTIDGAADAVGAALDALGITSAWVCGYSMGGPVSQCLTRDRPELVAGLVQIATAARVVPSSWRRQLLPVVSQLGRIGLEAGATIAALARPGDDLAGHALGTLRSSDKRALARAGAELARWDSRPWVSTLDVPAAVVITERDRAVPAAAQRELAELLGVPAEARISIATGHLACLQPRFGTTVAAALDAVQCVAASHQP